MSRLICTMIGVRQFLRIWWKAILTPDQWSKLPDDVKDPQTAMRRMLFGGQPGQNPNGQRRPDRP